MDASTINPRPNETLGAYVSRLRAARGLSLADVASASARFPEDERLSVSNLNAIERGTNLRPQRQRLSALARILGIPRQSLWQLAGHASEDPDALPSADDLSQRVTYRMMQLDDDQQQLVLDLIDEIRQRKRGEASQ